MAEKTKETRKTWVAIALGVVAALALFGLLWWSYDAFVPNRVQQNPNIADVTLPPDEGKLYDPASPVAAVHYQQASLVPSGPAVELPQDQVEVVGLSDEGYMLYSAFPTGVPGDARNWPEGGGGGTAPDAVPQAEAGLYLRTVDGRYLPLVEKR